MHTEGHDLGKDTAGNTKPAGQFDPENPGYEITDVNTGGVAVFLAGLFGFVVMFFFVCYGLGILINNGLEKQDGPATKWTLESKAVPAGKGANLASNPEMQQKELQQMTSTFPEPRLDIDDGNQATADLHAKEDLLLDHYSTVAGQSGVVRIPIDRAMQLIAQRGLPVATQGAPAEMLAGDAKPTVQVPLTTGFARTGYELTTIEAREQKMSYGKAEAETHAEVTPVK